MTADPNGSPVQRTRKNSAQTIRGESAAPVKRRAQKGIPRSGRPKEIHAPGVNTSKQNATIRAMSTTYAPQSTLKIWQERSMRNAITPGRQKRAAPGRNGRGRLAAVELTGSFDK